MLDDRPYRAGDVVRLKDGRLAHLGWVSLKNGDAEFMPESLRDRSFVGPLDMIAHCKEANLRALRAKSHREEERSETEMGDKKITQSLAEIESLIQLHGSIKETAGAIGVHPVSLSKFLRREREKEKSERELALYKKATAKETQAQAHTDRQAKAAPPPPVTGETSPEEPPQPDNRLDVPTAAELRFAEPKEAQPDPEPPASASSLPDTGLRITLCRVMPAEEAARYVAGVRRILEEIGDRSVRIRLEVEETAAKAGAGAGRS